MRHRFCYEPSLLQLTVVNPVAGARRARGGHGLIGMRERATLLGGGVETSTDAGCFRVRARIPLEGDA